MKNNINNCLFIFIFIIFKILNSDAQTTSCPIDSTWRPILACPNPVVVSPPISTYQAASDIVYGSNDLMYMAKWGSHEQSITNVPNSNGDDIFSVNFKPWAPDYFFIGTKTNSAPSIKANVNYQFSFDFKLGEPLGEINNYSNMTLSFYKPDDYRYFFWSYRDPIWALTFTGDFSSNTEFKTTTVTFSLPFDLGLSQLFLQVNRTRITDQYDTNAIFKNMKITVLPKPVSVPSDAVTVDSELIHIPKPSALLDEQDLTTCPYLSNDLVHWHDPATWGGSIPSPLSEITLPANKKVLISPCSISQTQVYKKIIIPASSELIFADSDITMHVQDIYVQGKFIMGTTKCRYNAFINIVFHGSKTLTDTIAPFYGSKGIAVASTGFISVQGKQYHSTWTKLSSTVWSGDRVIYVQDNVNWEVGQKVLITTSVYKDELDNQNEVKTIKAVFGKIIEFNEPFKFYHYGGKEYQAEVALLSRRIVFNGDGDGNSDLDSFGGHVLVNGEGQFAGIQLIKMGQTNIKARYPLHFHLAGVVENSYISDCSVTQSYYRCYTIHGTNNVTLTRNVAYDAYGHCYYLEDGVEMDNTLSFNLGAFVHTIGTPASGPAQVGETFIESADLRQPADAASGCFYITNAYNTIIGNAASGGWAGFSFPNLPAPIGNHQNVQMEPRVFTTKVFEGNTAHSSGYFFITGASIYVGGLLQIDPDTGLLVYQTGRHERNTCKDGIFSYDPNQFLWMRFNNTKIYLSNLGIGHWGNRVEVVSMEAYDSIRPGSLFGSTWLSNAIVDGQSGNILSKNPESNRQGFQFYDNYVQTILSHVTFRNFIHNPASVYEDDDNVALIGITFSDIYKPQYISATINISYINVPSAQIIGHRIEEFSGSSRLFNFIDWDGSAVNKNVPSIIGSHPNWWNFDSTCVFNNDWLVWVCDRGDRTVANLEIWIPGLIEPGVNHYGDSFVGYFSLFGNGITDIRKTNITRNAGITGVSKMGWNLFLNEGTPTYMDVWVSQVEFDQWILLAIPYPADTTFVIYTQNKWAWENYKGFNCTEASSLEQVKLGNGSLYYFDQTHLFIKVINNALEGDESEYFSRGGVKISYVYWEYHYHIHASNLNVQDTNGYYKDLQFSLPSTTL